MSAQIVCIIQKIADAKAKGKDLIEDSSQSGGLILAAIVGDEGRDEIINIAGDMEVVAADHFSDFSTFNQALLHVIKQASENGRDPLEAIRLWLESFNDSAQLSA